MRRIALFTSLTSKHPGLAKTFQGWPSSSARGRRGWRRPPIEATMEIRLFPRAPTEYSRFTLPLQFKREGLGYFIKTFFGLFVAASIAFLAFFMKPIDLDPRFGLGVGAIFAAIASEYVIVGALPESSGLSLADKLHVIAFSAILLSIVQSTYSLYLFTNNNEEKSKKLDFWSATLVPSGYLFATVLAVLFR